MRLDGGLSWVRIYKHIYLDLMHVVLILVSFTSLLNDSLSYLPLLLLEDITLVGFIEVIYCCYYY